ncbi:MAG: methyltransferase domain-containing protein [Dehalococcoidia bacterium]|nr:methyltransferase domain-containing protein [Dehalococcoidia bacterium]
MVDGKATAAVRRRYDRNAAVYDLMEGAVERLLFSGWRKVQWSRVQGKHILEVGVGTGKNFSYYPENADITAIDFSPKMLKIAISRAEKQKVNVRLQQMDVQSLEFPDNMFSTVVSTFVFCSVPDPVSGLREIRRVCQPGGKVVMLEHVLSANRILAALMNIANPLVVRLVGANINRKTVENVEKSGLVIEKVTELGAGIVKLIEARKPE